MEECPLCGSDVEVIDSGSYKGKVWYHYECTNPECQHEESEEPDWDSMPGGHDYE